MKSAKKNFIPDFDKYILNAILFKDHFERIRLRDFHFFFSKSHDFLKIENNKEIMIGFKLSQVKFYFSKNLQTNSDLKTFESELLFVTQNHIQDASLK